MFDIQTQLFDGQDVRLGPIDHEKDPEIESRWTHDSDFMRMYDTDPARPMSAAMVKKQFEEAKAAVLKYKDHPALLMWGVGNEMGMNNETPA